MHCCIPTPSTDSNTSTGMIQVTLNMPSADECHKPPGKCQGVSHRLESGHPENMWHSVCENIGKTAATEWLVKL